MTYMPPVFEGSRRRWRSTDRVVRMLLVNWALGLAVGMVYATATVAIRANQVLCGLALTLLGSGLALLLCLIVGAVATLYGIWLVYAAGPAYLLLAALLYAPGIIIYVIARRQAGQKLFTPIESLLALCLVLAGLTAAYLIWNGTISPF